MARPAVPTLRAKLRGVQESVNRAMANRENPAEALRCIQTSTESLATAQQTVLEHCGHRPVEDRRSSGRPTSVCSDCGEMIIFAGHELVAWRPVDELDDWSPAICAARLGGEED